MTLISPAVKLELLLEKVKKIDKYRFQKSFQEPLALPAANVGKLGDTYLFRSSWKKPYSEGGIIRMLEKYGKIAGLIRNISPHPLRHFLFTWLKIQGADDTLIQPYSGHETHASLEVYSKLSVSNAQDTYDEKIKNFPV